MSNRHCQYQFITFQLLPLSVSYYEKYMYIDIFLQLKSLRKVFENIFNY